MINVRNSYRSETSIVQTAMTCAQNKNCANLQTSNARNICFFNNFFFPIVKISIHLINVKEFFFFFLRHLFLFEAFYKIPTQKTIVNYTFKTVYRFHYVIVFERFISYIKVIAVFTFAILVSRVWRRLLRQTVILSSWINNRCIYHILLYTI